MFSSINFIVSALIFRSRIHFCSCCEVRSEVHFLLYWYPVSASFVGKTIHFPHWITMAPLLKINDHISAGLFLDSVFHADAYLSTSLSTHSLNYHIFIASPEIKYNFSNFILFENCFGRLWHFHKNFWITLSNATDKSAGILIGIVLNKRIN